MSAPQDHELHELLCAYLLGEVTDAERAQVEAALHRDPELAAERDRLAATIGLVQGTLGGPEAAPSLPPSVKEVLHDAAARRAWPRWYQSPVLRAAAGFAILIAGYAGYRVATAPPAGLPAPQGGPVARFSDASDLDRSSESGVETDTRDRQLNQSQSGEKSGLAKGSLLESEEVLEELTEASQNKFPEVTGQILVDAERGEISRLDRELRQFQGEVGTVDESVQDPAADSAYTPEELDTLRSLGYGGAPSSEAHRARDQGKASPPAAERPADSSGGAPIAIPGAIGGRPSDLAGAAHGVTGSSAGAPAPDPSANPSPGSPGSSAPGGQFAAEYQGGTGLGLIADQPGAPPELVFPPLSVSPTIDSEAGPESAELESILAGVGGTGGDDFFLGVGEARVRGAQLEEDLRRRKGELGEGFQTLWRYYSPDGISVDAYSADMDVEGLDWAPDSAGVPFLGDIPMLGYLFESGTETKDARGRFYDNSQEAALLAGLVQFGGQQQTVEDGAAYKQTPLGLDAAEPLNTLSEGAREDAEFPVAVLEDRTSAAQSIYENNRRVVGAVNELAGNGLQPEEIAAGVVEVRTPVVDRIKLPAAPEQPQLAAAAPPLEVVTALREAVAPETWNEEGNFIALDGDTLTIANRDDVREQVRKYLVEHGLYESAVTIPETRYYTLDYDAITDRFLHRCQRRPKESPSAMFFRYWGDNGFELALLDNESTFGADVDSASYTLARNYLNQGYLPTKEQVRTEEFVNFFAPDLAPPQEKTFGVNLELAPSLFGQEGQEHWMLRVGVRGKEILDAERDPLALVFVVDTSGSMSQENRIELVKHGLRLLMTELDARDTVAIVAFSSEARQILQPTPADQRALIEAAIHGLSSNGSTNAAAGLLMGYAQTETMRGEGITTRVVLLSDGVANTGETDQQRITESVRQFREKGVYLNTIGVGMGNHNDTLLEQLADKGDGLCAYIDDEAEAKRYLVDEFTSNFQPIARDVKIQVAFDPSQVESYRLLGYENRAIADIDFRNDAVDAGEIGSGHQVTALYEITRYPTSADVEAPLATATVRWLGPWGTETEKEAMEVQAGITAREAGGSWEGTTAGYRRSALVAQFAEFLRRSVHARGDSIETLIEKAALLAPQLEDPSFDEFVALVVKSRALIVRDLPRDDDLTRAVDAIRENHLLRAQITDLLAEEDLLLDEELRRLEERNQELGNQLRDLLKRRLEREH